MNSTPANDLFCHASPRAVFGSFNWNPFQEPIEVALHGLTFLHGLVENVTAAGMDGVRIRGSPPNGYKVMRVRFGQRRQQRTSRS